MSKTTNLLHFLAKYGSLWNIKTNSLSHVFPKNGLNRGKFIIISWAKRTPSILVKGKQTSNINFGNVFLLKRCLYASRSFSLGSMSHSFVFEGRNRMSLLYSLHQCFYFKIASQRWRKYIRNVHEVILN